MVLHSFSQVRRNHGPGDWAQGLALRMAHDSQRPNRRLGSRLPPTRMRGWTSGEAHRHCGLSIRGSRRRTLYLREGITFDRSIHSGLRLDSCTAHLPNIDLLWRQLISSCEHVPRFTPVNVYHASLQPDRKSDLIFAGNMFLWSRVGWRKSNCQRREWLRESGAITSFPFSVVPCSAISKWSTKDVV